MSLTASIPIRPFTSFSHATLRNPIKISAFTLDFPLPKSVRRNTTTRRRPNSMNGGAVAARMDDDDDDEDVPFSPSLEQEAFINASKLVGASVSGLEAVLNKLSKWLFAVVFGVILLWRHDAQTLWASIGSILNSALSHILKRILNQKRPGSTSRSDPGMPSSHAQSIFYIVTFAIVSMVQWFGLNGLTAALAGLIFALGSYFSWLRISQKLHTVNQVLVGAAIGLGFSVVWLWLWDAIVLKAFISFLWVRIIVVLAAVGLCSSFVIYVVRYWVLDEQ
ncbi:PREDICTED: lipid phosphate phosphatase epsilon 1, chloroplastic-like [Ipomoea nil]|uniref:lipid phosphate phosphatase epsilon 1, chloroplastic-like n=1 Tax=Ipomoea nil TaxID=35883 RepID=UPI000901C17F|nr:PREDICTED: lipid phosphate phosphatase epsilon 1, chloroplastic-like [Ipomoea nil]